MRTRTGRVVEGVGGGLSGSSGGGNSSSRSSDGVSADKEPDV